MYIYIYMYYIVSIDWWSSTHKAKETDDCLII